MGKKQFLPRMVVLVWFFSKFGLDVLDTSGDIVVEDKLLWVVVVEDQVLVLVGVDSFFVVVVIIKLTSLLSVSLEHSRFPTVTKYLYNKYRYDHSFNWFFELTYILSVPKL